MDRSQFKLPFYANIFSYLASDSHEGYAEADEATIREVQNVPGFLGHEVTGDGKRRIFISYWRDLKAIDQWQKNHVHQAAKQNGKEWYAAYHSMVVKIESHSLWNTNLL